MLEIYEYDQTEIDESWFDWSGGLWWPDFEEAGIEKCFVAFLGDEVVGFQTVNASCDCVAIEAKYQNQGIGRALVQESGCYRPDRNECPEFWAKMTEEFGN